MHRRHFLKSGGLVLAGLGVAGVGRSAAPGDTISVGVIGTGVRGQQLLDYLLQLPSFRVAGVCDVLPFRLDEARKQVGAAVPATADYRRLLDDPDIDAVVVATTFSEHYRIALDAIDAGKHVYCEKSMVKGIEPALRLRAAALARPALIFQTGFQYHSSPLYSRAAEMVANGDLGEIAAIECQWNRNGDWRRKAPDPKWERQVNWRMYREYSSGLTAELSAHQMDFCNTLLGDTLESVQGVGGIDYWKDGRETYDNVHLNCRYGNGVTARFTSLTTNSLNGYRIALLGKKGSIILTTRRGWFVPEGSADALPDTVDLVSGASVADGSQGAWQKSNDAGTLRIDAPDDDPTPRALEDFMRAILDGRQPDSNVRTGARASIMVQMAIDAMDRSTVETWQDSYDDMASA